MPRKTKTAEVLQDSYVREICRKLDGPFDKEAVRLLMDGGALAVEDPARIADAVERLDKKVFTPSEDAETRLADAIDTAYYLGIAVGRRLGGMRLSVPAGGAR